MKYRRALSLPLLMLLVCASPVVLAQQGAQPPGGNTGNGTGSRGPSRPEIIPSPRQAPAVLQPAPPQIFFSGTVMQEDGSPPPFGTVVERECRGTTTREAMTDSNGRFSFQVGDVNRLGSLMPDASERLDDSFFNDQSITNSRSDSLSMASSATTAPRFMQNTELMGCEIRARLAGFRSTAVRIDAAPQQGPNEIGTIIIYRIERIRGTTVSASNLLAPKQARKMEKKGRRALEKNKLEDAEKYLKSAINVYPKYGEAWADLGMLYQRQNKSRQARDAYGKAMESDKLYVRPYIELGWLASLEQKWREAADYTERALDLDPITYPDMYYLNALANFNLSNLELSEKRARQELRLDPKRNFPQVHMILANIYTLRKDDQGAIAEMRNYLKYAAKASDANVVRSRIDALEKAAAGAKNRESSLQPQKP